MVRVEGGNCLEVMRRLAVEGVKVDAIVTDPPYHLTGSGRGGFMGKAWDGGDVAFNSVTWGTAAGLLKPGGHLLAFGGTRTFGRLQWAIEGGGFEVRDMVLWLYGSGFPKSHDVSKAIDKMQGVERPKVRTEMGPTGNKYAKGLGDDRPWMQEAAKRGYHEHDNDEPQTDAAKEWQGWGTALKPACEPICLARKCLSEPSVAANLLKHRTGALNVDGCRVGTDITTTLRPVAHRDGKVFGNFNGGASSENLGRWPANVVHDGSPEVEDAFAAFGESKSGPPRESSGSRTRQSGFAMTDGNGGHNDSGTASRFFYTAKADAHDRWGSKHPTVKPIDLMRWLVRLVTPSGGTVLDPFAGSGTTAVACLAEGFDCILIEREEEYLADIRERLAHYSGEGRHSLSAKGRKRETRAEDLPLFAGGAD